MIRVGADRSRWVPVAVAALLGSGSVAATASAVGAQTAVAEAAYHSLSVGDGSLTEVVFPVGVSWRFGGVRFDANTAFASARYEQDGFASELSGLTDVTVRALVPLLEDRGRIIVAANVPTGQSALAEDELQVAAVLTTDLLTLPVRSFGSGAGVTTGFAYARPVGSLVLGGITLYRVGSAYEPVVGTGGAAAAEFRPGSELRVRLAVERPVVGGVSWRAAASWSRFGDDEADQREIFSRGDRFLGELNAEFPLMAGAASVYGWNLYRTESQLLTATGTQPAPGSNLAGVGAQVVYPLSPALRLRPKAELLVQSGDPGFGGGSGYIGRVGSGMSYGLGGMRLEPAVMLQIGSLEGQDIFGLMLRGGILWER